ncbi:MAG: C1 family peptidase [Ferruginibacter sp.]
MKKFLTVSLSFLITCASIAQIGVKAQVQSNGFVVEKNNAATPVKDQARTGTCWSFSTTSLLESQFLKNFNNGALDLSEMFTVYNIYIEKAKNYVMRQGATQFNQGGLGHDVVRSVSLYGAMPESAFTGLKEGERAFNHTKAVVVLKEFLDNLLKSKPVNQNWLQDYKKLLNDAIGTPPSEFEYNGKKYTPKTFASEVLKYNSNEYVNITSFTHHPYNAPFILEVPDNFSNGSYYNIPLSDMIQLVKNAVNKGYTILWDADVSNSGFVTNSGLALFVNIADKESGEPVTADMKELDWNVALRQQYFENLTTQDDHLMHITGIERSKEGKEFFIVKNSWGQGGPYKGYMNVSTAYFAMNTVSMVVPKAAFDNGMLLKLGIR